MVPEGETMLTVPSPLASIPLITEVGLLLKAAINPYSMAVALLVATVSSIRSSPLPDVE